MSLQGRIQAEWLRNRPAISCMCMQIPCHKIERKDASVWIAMKVNRDKIRTVRGKIHIAATNACYIHQTSTHFNGCTLDDWCWWPVMKLVFLSSVLLRLLKNFYLCHSGPSHLSSVTFQVSTSLPRPKHYDIPIIACEAARFFHHLHFMLLSPLTDMVHSGHDIDLLPMSAPGPLVQIF